MKEKSRGNKSLFLKELGKRIVKEREERGISQKELSEMIKVNPTALRRIEKGKVNTSIYQLVMICDALEIKICTLIKTNCVFLEQANG